MSRIRCIVTDLDGTALNPRGRLSHRNRRAIEAAISQGIQVIIASGRSLESLPGDIKDIEGIRYAVTSNGAAVYDIQTGACLRQYKLEAETVEEILRETREWPVALEGFIDGKPYAQKEYVERPVSFGASGRAVGYIQSTRTPIEDMRAFLSCHKEELESIDVVVKNEEEKRKLWKTLEQNVSNVYITSSVPQLLEISHEKAGKVSGVSFLLERLNCPREALAAFGDGDNDREMLEYAGLGIAMENAAPSCKAAADFITGSNQEDGVGTAILGILEGEITNTD